MEGKLNRAVLRFENKKRGEKYFAVRGCARLARERFGRRMNKHARWLLVEVGRWEADGLVSAEQARRLREHYAEPDDAASWGAVVFASAGAVVVGLGVILMLAYNWDEIPKFGKLGLVFASVVAMHAGGLRCAQIPDWRRQIGAVLHLLGTMFFGAGIWLVAQVYHLDEHFPNGFLIWGLGALAMAWALDSVLQALLAAVLLAIWGGCEVFSFRDPNLWALPLVVAAIAPLAWRRRSAVLLAVMLTAAQFLLLANLSSFGSGAHMLTSSFAWGAFLIAAARLTAGGDASFAGGAEVATFFGFLTLILCAYLLSFLSSWRYVLGWGATPMAGQEIAMLHSWILFGLAAAAWAVVAARRFAHKLGGVQGAEWLVPVALAYGYALIWGRYPVLTRCGAHPFNLLLLGIASAWMWQGCRESRLKPTVLGSLLLAAVVIARYFDLFQSLAARGLAFVILGAVIMGEAVYYRRCRAKLAAVVAT
jgi:uncharacterized membrane protein